MGDHQLLIEAYKNARMYPKNTVRPTTSKHYLNKLYQRLQQHEERLFCKEKDAQVDIWEHTENSTGFQLRSVKTANELNGLLASGNIQIDPYSRFVFVQAPTSRARLRITHEMLALLLTYHQVMPGVLDFVFPFGFQRYAEDFYFSGKREDNRMLASDKALIIPELGRSGRELRMCYSLKSVEPTGSSPKWPWSVRQTALYHSFDIVTGKAFWMVIKGNSEIKDRILQSSMDAATPDTSTAASFAATLEIQLTMFEWCSDDWRWFLTFLETKLQGLTRPALTAEIPRPLSFAACQGGVLDDAENTFVETSPKSFIRRASISTKQWILNSKHSSTKSKFEAPCAQPAPTTNTRMDPGSSSVLPERKDIFSVSTLQQVQSYEEKASEAVLFLDSNIKIIQSIDAQYHGVFYRKDSPVGDNEECLTAVDNFKRRVYNILGELEMQKTTAEVLLSLVKNRKDLLSGLLNLRNVEASNKLAEESHASSKSMEGMTKSMQDIAVETKQETVSMRIITLVTLFFLPGTFISTIMSTDIISFQTTKDSGEVFQLGALQLYLAITLPLMLLTFAAWGIVYKYIDRKAKHSSHA